MWLVLPVRPVRLVRPVLPVVAPYFEVAAAPDGGAGRLLLAVVLVPSPAWGQAVSAVAG